MEFPFTGRTAKFGWEQDILGGKARTAPVYIPKDVSGEQIPKTCPKGSLQVKETELDCPLMRLSKLAVRLFENG